jgi:hypothetical protein
MRTSTSSLQRRRLRRGRAREGHRRDRLEGALPERLHRVRQGTAPRAAVLLRRLLAGATSSATSKAATPSWSEFPSKPPSSSTTRIPPSPSLNSCASSSMRKGCRLGAALGDLPENLLLHQPHAAPRGARKVERRLSLSACCPAISRSSTRSITSSSRRSRGTLARRQREETHPLPHRGVAVANMSAWPTCPSSAHATNGVAALHTVCFASVCSRSSTSSIPSASSTHQRRHLPPLARCLQSAALRPHHQVHRPPAG